MFNHIAPSQKAELTIMGLDVEVVGDSSKSFSFGSYATFAKFRTQFAHFTHAKKYADEYSTWMHQLPVIFAPSGMKPKELSSEFKSLDIWPLYLLSDSDDRITQAECKDLFTIFNKHKAVLKKKDVDSEFKKNYRKLMAAFKAGRGDSSTEIGVVFC